MSFRLVQEELDLRIRSWKINILDSNIERLWKNIHSFGFLNKDLFLKVPDSEFKITLLQFNIF